MAGVILMYHRIAESDADHYRLAVHPARFVQHVELFAELGYVVPLAGATVRSRPEWAAVTFDDGYVDNALVAAPLLAAASIPATYFVTSGGVAGGRFWWDRLAAALLRCGDTTDGIDVEISGDSFWLALNDANARRTSLAFVHWRLSTAPARQVHATIEDIVTRVGCGHGLGEATAMNTAQLRELADMPLADIGAHTRTHVRLSSQDVATQRDEIVGSMEDLSGATGRPITAFAYPFGTPGAVGDIAPRLVREAGCTVACTTDEGAVTNRSDPYRLPRVRVGDWDATTLRDRIHHVLGRR